MDSNEQGRYRVLAVFAHPDDESCGPGGTLARCAAGGMDVHLLCVTRGEFGGEPTSDKRPDPLLGDRRSSELGAACRALGVGTCTILNHPDGFLHECDQVALVRDIVRVIRQSKPRIVITAHPEEEMTGDHAAIARITTLAWTTAGSHLFHREQFFEGLTPHLADLLLYYHHGSPTEDQLSRLDFLRVNVSDYRWQKAAALRCHVTQSVCTSAALRVLEDEPVLYEHFVIGYSSLPADHQLLTELFEPL